MITPVHFHHIQRPCCKRLRVLLIEWPAAGTRCTTRLWTDVGVCAEIEAERVHVVGERFQRARWKARRVGLNFVARCRTRRRRPAIVQQQPFVAELVEAVLDDRIGDRFHLLLVAIIIITRHNSSVGTPCSPSHDGQSTNAVIHRMNADDVE